MFAKHSSNTVARYRYAVPCIIILFCIIESGEVYAWGNNEYGQLGLVTPQEQVRDGH